jgi:hypothetical protein
MRNEIKLTDGQILEAFLAAGHDDLDMDDLVLTLETLEGFRTSATTWAECKSVSNETYATFAAVEFDGVQVNPGQKRHALTVIDFGAVRASYK